MYRISDALRSISAAWEEAEKRSQADDENNIAEAMDEDTAVEPPAGTNMQPPATQQARVVHRLRVNLPGGGGPRVVEITRPELRLRFTRAAEEGQYTCEVL